VILQQVQFQTGTAKLTGNSDEILEEVASVLKQRTEVAKLEVQGHTDNKGNKAANKTLSQSRADSVMKALVAKGIEADRLSAKGYGQDEPIADNATEEGRQKNRRVQFKILEKKKKQQ
jgi:outer membrane protein OmpA-like peptidoglycan-associated protein